MTNAQERSVPQGGGALSGRSLVIAVCRLIGHWHLVIGHSLLILLALLAVCAQAGEPTTPSGGIAFPPDAGVHNIRDYGARGDGVTDDTAALQQAFQEWSKKHMEIIYFPNGTYLVSGQVWFAEWVFVQGESREKTILRLKDHCPGYDDLRNPRAVVGTTDPRPSVQCRNMNFSTHMINFTIDTGKGNPGANGIEFMSHNGGGLENVTVRSGDGEGMYGIDMTRNGPGPALCRNVRVEGFNYGLSVANDVYCSVFEGLALAGQKVAGLRNVNHPVAIRGLTSANAVPAIQNVRDGGQIVLLDGDLAGGAADTCAIENRTGGSLYLRNVKTAGYKAAIQERIKTVPGPLDEYFNEEVRTLFPSKAASLRLPIKETPALPWEPFENWVSVKTFADKAAGGDWAPAIQAAIDSGKTTVYFPHGKYPLRSTVHVRGKVRVLQGCGSMLEAGDGLKDKTVLLFDNPGGGTVFVDRLSFAAKTWAMPMTQVEHATPQTLVVLHSRWMSYRGRTGCGELFVDDMCGAPWHFAPGQKVWIRELDVESKDTKVFNDGAHLWVLGIKAEGTGINIVNTSGARTEVLGGEIYPACRVPDDVPMWENTDAAISLVHSIFWANTLYVKDTRRGETKELRIPKGHRFMAFVDCP
jgi:hypothetical protein